MCSASDCPLSRCAGGLIFYERAPMPRTSGDSDLIFTKRKQRKMGAIDRLMLKVSPEPNSGCWLWTGAFDPNGYGRFHFRGNGRLAHRVCYELMRGPISDELQLDHLCRTPACVNPEHLEPVTAMVNQHRSPITNATKTHCAKGHPYAGENLSNRSNGSRRCLECHRNSMRKQRHGDYKRERAERENA